jgi:hypothetical protein
MRATRTTLGNNVTVSMGNATTLATTVMENTYSICGKRIASVPVALMELDESYQRVLGKTTKKLMAEWDNDKCDFLIVSYRNNRFYIIDGQHRYSVAKAKGIVSLPCIIFTGLTQQDEALKFAQQQDNVNKLSPYDTFKANIACGDTSIREIAIDMEIKRVCDKHNIIVKKGKSKNEKILKCLGNVRIFHQNFEWVMDVVNASNWANCPKAYTENLYLALSRYYNESEDDTAIAEQKIINMMNSISPEELIAKAKYEYPEYAIKTALNLCIKDLTKPSAN